MGKRNSSGFSRIELLVVIGIVAVLMAIVLPFLEKAWEEAVSTKRASNIRQIGQALLIYANENGGAPSGSNWFTSDSGHVKISGGMFCNRRLARFSFGPPATGPRAPEPCPSEGATNTAIGR